MENWKTIVKEYSTPDHKKSWLQLANTLIPYCISWSLSMKYLEESTPLATLFIFITAMFSLRLFIFMHDCGHGSFFKINKLRTFVGYLTGSMCFTPYHQWSKEHATHHNHSGNLDKRGRGDIWTMTTEEYEVSSSFEKFKYRLYRNPFVTFILGPFYLFFLRYRFTSKLDGRKERRSVHITNLILLLSLGTLSYLFGIMNVLIVQFSIQYLVSVSGVLLFYVQHQYEEVYWKDGKAWNYKDSALQGSSYLKLPKPLQWLSGNIGIHHIHHLSHKIPNYNLQKCMDENEIFQNPKTITITTFLKCFGLHLIDKKEGDLISFSEYKKRYIKKSYKLKRAHA